MIKVRKNKERGHFNHGWLNTYHTFSFGDYLDPNHMGFRSLRVINEDVVQPSMGFGMHGHKDMEIITYPIQGSLAHKDSLGHASVIHTGDIQYMGAGTGIQHSEFNPSSTALSHFLQIWVVPDQKNHLPRYQQQPLPTHTGPESAAVLFASGREVPNTLHIRQDIEMLTVFLFKNKPVSYVLKKQRHAWVQVVEGCCVVNGVSLEQGDGLCVSEISDIDFNTENDSARLLLCDLA